MQACWKTEKNLPCISLCMRDNMMSSSQKGTTEVDHGVYHQHFGGFFCSMFQIFALMLYNNAGTVRICEYFYANMINSLMRRSERCIHKNVGDGKFQCADGLVFVLHMYPTLVGCAHHLPFLLLVWRNKFVTFSVYLTELTGVNSSWPQALCFLKNNFYLSGDKYHFNCFRAVLIEEFH